MKRGDREDCREEALFSCLQCTVQRQYLHLSSVADTDTHVFIRRWSEESADGVPTALWGFPPVSVLKNKMLCSPVKNDSLGEPPLKPRLRFLCVISRRTKWSRAEQAGWGTSQQPLHRT